MIKTHTHQPINDMKNNTQESLDRFWKKSDKKFESLADDSGEIDWEQYDKYQNKLLKQELDKAYEKGKEDNDDTQWQAGFMGGVDSVKLEKKKVPTTTKGLTKLFGQMGNFEAHDYIVKRKSYNQAVDDLEKLKERK